MDIRLSPWGDIRGRGDLDPADNGKSAVVLSWLSRDEEYWEEGRQATAIAPSLQHLPTCLCVKRADGDMAGADSQWSYA